MTGRPLTDEEIERRLEAFLEGDSNDEEIDGLRDIIGELQTERTRLYAALEQVPMPALRDLSVFWDAWEAAQDVLPKEVRPAPEAL